MLPTISLCLCIDVDELAQLPDRVAVHRLRAPHEHPILYLRLQNCSTIVAGAACRSYIWRTILCSTWTNVNRQITAQIFNT